jgi:hypothetical protein
MAVAERGVVVDSDLSSDLVAIMEVSPHALDAFAPGSFPRIFWEAQQKCSSLSNLRSMRWDPVMIKWCIYLRHLSSSVYETLQQSSMLYLSSQRTLRDYTHYIPSHSGQRV